jgi:hypothetical protein
MLIDGIEADFDTHFYLLKTAVELNKESEYFNFANAFSEEYQEELMEEELLVLGQVFYANNVYKATTVLMYNALLFESRDDFYYLRGLSRFHMGDHIGAIEDVTSAMTLSPKRVKYYQKRIELKRAISWDKSADLDQEVFHRKFN